MDYIRDGSEIYRRSFETIRAESDLAALPSDVAGVVVRMIHACGMTDLPEDVRYDPRVVDAARSALNAGAPILCDAKMVASGVTRPRLPADNALLCCLDDPRTAALAVELETTRSAAAVELWRDRLAGSVVAIGNAPTTLFHLLARLDEGWPKPAAIVGLPVGFIGAAESKAELVRNCRGVPYLTLLGRRGGSAMAVAALNALADPRE